MTNCRNPANLELMVREISAGGVVVRHMQGAWHVALIEPNRDTEPAAQQKTKSQAPILALPKGLVDPGEKAVQTALREVGEETGVSASLITKLIDIKYMYVRSWGDTQRVFKIVTFYLLRYESGNIDEVSPDMRLEVRRALWVPLDEAVQRLTYKSERQVVLGAKQYLETHPEVMGSHSGATGSQR